MMTEPSMVKILSHIPNRYMIVNIAAKRARQIAMLAEEQDEILDEKPVTLALREIAEGKIEVLDRPAPDTDYIVTSAPEKAEASADSLEERSVEDVVDDLLSEDDSDEDEEAEEDKE